MRLKCIAGTLQGEVFELEASRSYLLGREPSGEGLELIQLPSSTVSRKHARIDFENGVAVIQDLESANGVRVNRKRLERTKLQKGDRVEMGAFSFLVEESANLSEEISEKTDEPITDKKSVRDEEPIQNHAVLSKAQNLWAQFQRLELKSRVLILLIASGLIVHFGITSPLISDARLDLLQHSFAIAESAIRSLADRNKRELAEGSYFLLDCEVSKRVNGVSGAQLFDAKGKPVCPVGSESVQDELMEGALYRGEALNNCKARIIQGSESDCDFVLPIREWRDQQGQYVTVGVARLKYSPKEAEIAVQNLQSLKFKTLIFCLLVLLGMGWILQLWIRREVSSAVEGVHLAVTGTTQSLENLASFAALDPLIEEINRLISKGNQGVRKNSSELTEEASFLHSLLQQVLLLEDRAVMVVDKDNQLIAVSPSLPEVVPVEVSQMNIHITEAVADTHLQGDLILLLNDLGQSNEVIDRALSMADRVLQTRGMPIFLRDEFVAAILIF